MCFYFIQPLSPLLALSSFSSLLLLLLLPPLLLLLPCSWVRLLVLARADGAAWVRLALERDLVCRTSCPACSTVSCWAALICSACVSIAAWSFKSLQPPPTPCTWVMQPFPEVRLKPDGSSLAQSVPASAPFAFSARMSLQFPKSCVCPAETSPSPLEQPVLLLLWLLLGRGGGRGEAGGASRRSWLAATKNHYLHQSRTASEGRKRCLLLLTTDNPQGKKRYLCRVI